MQQQGAGAGEQVGDATLRGWGWQSCAATGLSNLQPVQRAALRNLRPGRRMAQGVQQAAEGTKSRMFLIYIMKGAFCGRAVIGDAVLTCFLCSFQVTIPEPSYGHGPGQPRCIRGAIVSEMDAGYGCVSGQLWWHRRLAELLGQVKTQVATREDINKSDLQIVKCSELG